MPRRKNSTLKRSAEAKRKNACTKRFKNNEYLKEQFSDDYDDLLNERFLAEECLEEEEEEEDDIWIDEIIEKKDDSVESWANIMSKMDMSQKNIPKSHRGHYNGNSVRTKQRKIQETKAIAQVGKNNGQTLLNFYQPISNNNEIAENNEEDEEICVKRKKFTLVFLD